MNRERTRILTSADGARSCVRFNHLTSRHVLLASPNGDAPTYPWYWRFS